MEEKQDGGDSQVGGEGTSVAGSAPAALAGASPWSSTTCSPDTDSPVIINEHVSERLLGQGGGLHVT